MANLEYLVLLALCVAITLPLELALGTRVYRQTKRLVLTLACVGAVFVAWDLLGAQLGHWDYNPRHVTGIRLLTLPLEEYLFLLVVPLCAILTYEAARLTIDEMSRWLRDRLPSRPQRNRA